MSHIDEGVLEAYLDGETGEQERRKVEQHLESCIECRERLVEVTTLSRSVSALLAELEPGPVQPPPWRELEERAAERMTAPQGRSWLRPGLAWAASLFLAFSIGWWSSNLWQRTPGAAFEVAEGEEPARASVDATEKKEGSARFDEERRAEERRRRVSAPEFAETLAVEEQRREDDEGATPTIVTLSKAAPDRTDHAEGFAGVAAEGELEYRGPSRADAEQARESASEAAAPAERAQQLEGPEPDSEAAELRSAVEESRPESAAPEGAKMRAAQSRPTPEPTPADFLISMATDPDDAASRLGGELRTLPDLELQRVEVVPGSGVEGGLDHLPAVRMIYLDAAGHEIVLVQQLLSVGERAGVPAEPTLLVEPSGLKSYRWRDGEGYLLILRGEVSSDSLRSLADLVR